MHVFVTGATGWVGQALVEDLLKMGHRVTGLVRSAEKALGIVAGGATIIRGSLDDLDGLRQAARDADAVAHTAFNHDWTNFANSAAQDELAIRAIGEALIGTAKPFLVTSGLAGIASGRLATEEDRPDPASIRRSEAAAQALVAKGVCAATIRLAPSVHGVGETHGFVPMLIKLAREKGVSAYIGEGANRWAGVYGRDAARLFRQVLEAGARHRQASAWRWPVLRLGPAKVAEDPMPCRIEVSGMARRDNNRARPKPTPRRAFASRSSPFDRACGRRQ